MNPIRFTLLISLLAILLTILAALFAPSAPADQADSSGPERTTQSRLGQAATAGRQ